MNIVLNIIIVIAALIALLLIIALFVKKEYSVAREVVINRPNREIFDFIRLMRNQNLYNKWWTADPNAKMDFKGIDGTVGFTAYWDSENKQVGKGEQEITKITDGERIDCEIRFIRPFEGVADVYMETTPLSANQAKVNWVFAGKNKYPMNLMNLFIDKMLGNDLGTSINNLKSALEK
jgi:hypothetical protein